MALSMTGKSTCKPSADSSSFEVMMLIATAAPGGCRQRHTHMITMAEHTATLAAVMVFPNKRMHNNATSVEIR